MVPVSSLACVISAIRRMKSSAASTTPTDTARTMSKMTVSEKQAMSTMASERGATRRMCPKCRTSAMFLATTSSNAASAAIGR